MAAVKPTIVNWIPDENRWKLPSPPAWFLQQLADFDPMLVIFPSRLRPCFILARRRTGSLRMPALVKLDHDLVKKTAAGDGNVMATHQLVYVEMITGYGAGSWSPGIFAQLRARDTWAAGGADKMIAQIEEAEKSEAESKRKTLLDNIDHRARDAWRSFQARTGSRNHHAANSGKRARREKPASSRTVPGQNARFA